MTSDFRVGRSKMIPKIGRYKVKIVGHGRYSDVSIKNIDILPNRQYIANTADSAQEHILIVTMAGFLDSSPKSLKYEF